jgi:hypothetical protein
VNLGGALIEGDLNLQDVKLEGDLFCTPRDGERPEVRGTIIAHSGRVTGRLTLSGLKVSGDVNLSAIDVSGAVLRRAGRSSLRDWRHGSATGCQGLREASFNAARLGGDLNLAKPRDPRRPVRDSPGRPAASRSAAPC